MYCISNERDSYRSCQLLGTAARISHAYKDDLLCPRSSTYLYPSTRSSGSCCKPHLFFIPYRVPGSPAYSREWLAGSCHFKVTTDPLVNLPCFLIAPHRLRAPIATMLSSLFTLVVATILSSWSCFAISLDRLRGPHVQDLTTILDTSRYNDGKGVMRRAEANVGYLGVFFLGADPYVYFYLSNGNNAASMKALNKGQPIMRPTKGTGGVRDPMIIPGGGKEAGKKWYIIGTDLHIGKVSHFG
jgi:hypothetical protein